MEVLVPQDPSGFNRSSVSSLYLRMRVDTLDPIAFPVRGTLLTAQWNRDTLQGVAAQPPPQSQLSAPLAPGGFLRLSGTAPESINGSTVVLGWAVLARRIGSLPMPFGNAIRAGFSAELGNGFASGQGTFYLFLGPIW